MENTHKFQQFEIQLTIENVAKIVHLRKSITNVLAGSKALSVSALQLGQIENTFYTITNFNEIDLSR